jgi:heme exporter protein D
VGQFESLQAFIEMGGHGLYVWMSYGIGAAVILYNVMSAASAKRNAEQRARKYVRRQELEG